MKRSRGTLQSRINSIKNNIVADNKIDAAELIDVLTDVNDSMFNDGTDSFPAAPSVGGSNTLDQAPVLFDYNKALIAFGNSITMHDYYVRSISDYLRCASRTAFTNAGESTRGQIKRITQEGALPTNRTAIVSWMNGINDIRFNNSTTNYKFRHVEHVREFLCNAFAASITTSASPASTSGTWVNWDKGTANNGRTNGRYTTDLNGSMTFNFPAGVKSIFVSFFTNFPADSEDFSNQVEISAEGVLVDTINLNKRSTGYDHYTWHLPRTYFEASGGGGVTIVNKNSGKKMIVDYFGYLMDAKDVQPAIVWDNSYVANQLMVAGFTEGGNTVPSGITRAWFDECDAAARQMIVESFTKYGYPVAMPRTNTFFEPADYTYTPGVNTSTAGQWDGLHPNYQGHAKMFDALRLVSLIDR
jgi:hypothetical protein